MKKIIVIFALCFFLIGSVFPVGLVAEQTYAEFNSGCMNFTNSYKYSGTYRYKQISLNADDVRVVGFIQEDGNRRLTFVLVSKTQFGMSSNDNNVGNVNNYPTSCVINTNYSNATQYTYNGETFYINYGNSYMYSGYSDFQSLIPSEVVSNNNISNTLRERAIELTFGSEAVGSGPSYGDLADIGYYTKIAGQGLSNVNNVDVITWNNILDSNGEFVSLKGYQAQVDIKAVSSHYKTLTPGAVQWNDLIIDQDIEAELATQLFNQGSFSVSWGNVAEALDQSLDLLDPYINDIVTQEWQSNGWVYYARLRVPDADYTGSWQLIYSTASAPPSVIQPLTDPGGLTPEVINAIEQINIQNNTTNNWYIDNTEVPMNDTSDPQDRDSFWEKLLQALVSLVNNLINAIKDLLLGLLDLFRFDAFDIPDFEERKELYIEHTGLFGETLKFHESVKELLLGVEPAEPIFHYPGFVMNDVQLIPEMTINLNDYVEEQGFADLHAMAYTVTDGVIFLLLLLNVKNRIMEALSK